MEPTFKAYPDKESSWEWPFDVQSISCDENNKVTMSEPIYTSCSVCTIDQAMPALRYKLCACFYRGQHTGFAIWNCLNKEWNFGSTDTPMKWEHCWDKIKTLMASR